jgi:RNA polymerase sigma-70 factor (ECF subfamily)
MDHEQLHRKLPHWIEHVRRHLSGHVGSRRLAADLAQEAGLRLLDVVARGEELREPRAWLFRVARNLAVDEIRRRTPQSMAPDWQAVVPDPRVEEEEPVYRLAGGEMGRGEVLELLPAAMGALTAHDRGWLVGFYHGGRSCERLAVEHGVSADAGKVRLHRARRRLAMVLARTVRARAATRAELPARPGVGIACAAMLSACAPAMSQGAAPDSSLTNSPAAAATELASTSDDTVPEVRAGSAQEQLQQARHARSAAMGQRGPARIRALEAAARAYGLVAEHWPQEHELAAEACFRRGEILRSLQQDGEAYGAFLEALDAAKLAEDEVLEARARLELGRAQRRAERRLQAIAWFAEAAAQVGAPLRLRNDAREALAELRLELAQWQAALTEAREWRARAESLPEEARALLLIARALRGLGYLQEAEQELQTMAEQLRERALDPEPEGPQAQRALERIEELMREG